LIRVVQLTIFTHVKTRLKTLYLTQYISLI